MSNKLQRKSIEHGAWSREHGGKGKGPSAREIITKTRKSKNTKKKKFTTRSLHFAPLVVGFMDMFCGGKLPEGQFLSWRKRLVRREKRCNAGKARKGCSRGQTTEGGKQSSEVSINILP